MRKVNLFALLVFTGTLGSVQAEFPGGSLRSGGCSDLYGTTPGREASSGASAKQSDSRVRLVSTAGDTAVYVGLFRKGGCTHGGSLTHVGQGRQGQCGDAATVTYYQAPAASYYQAPLSNAVIAYGNSVQSNAGSGAIVVQTDQRSLMDCGPVNSYKVVLEPKYFTESRAVGSTEYQTETRYRTRIVRRTVPVETQDYKTITVMVPRSETKTVEYTVLVPQTSEKTVEVVETVPVWTEVPEEYTVKVPQVIDVPEEYKVRVAQLADQEFTYTVHVPQSTTETRMHAVTNVVPVTKTRTVQNYQPVTRMQSVTKDYGHWEDRVEEVTVAAPAPVANCAAPMYSAPAYSTPVTYAFPSYDSGAGAGQYGNGPSNGPSSDRGCRLFHRGGCGSGYGHASPHGCGNYGNTAGCGCGSGSGSSVGGGGLGGCGSDQVVYSQPGGQNYGAPAYGEAAQYNPPTTQTVHRRVWVPNVVTEQVPVVENVIESQEVAYTVFEQHTEQVPYECTYLVYRPETRTGTRKVVNYVEESRTRNRKVVQYNDETRTRTLKKLSYKQQTRSETIPVISYTSEKRTKEVSYTFDVPETRVEPFTTTRFETVNEEASEEYTVTVPVATTREVQVQVCRMVPKLVPVTIYPCACAEAPQQDYGCAAGCGCADCR